MIEHNLDVIKVSDRLIDLGPEGGDEGGQLIAVGTPEEVAQVAESHTGQFLAEILPVRVTRGQGTKRPAASRNGGTGAAPKAKAKPKAEPAANGAHGNGANGSGAGGAARNGAGRTTTKKNGTGASKAAGGKSAARARSAR